MKSKVILSILLLACGAVLTAKPLTLVKDGKAASSIVVADNASEVARTAAELLAEHVERVSGAKLPIVSESQNPAGTKIYVGATNAAARAGLGVEKFVEEAWQIKAVDGNLYVAGGENNGKIFYQKRWDLPVKKTQAAWNDNGFYRLTRRGPIYAAVKFLDKNLGVRWLWPGELGTVIPKKSTITVAENYELSGKPAFLYRKYRIGAVVNAYLRNNYKISDDLKMLSFTPDALESYYKNVTRFLLIHQEGDSCAMPAPASHIDGVSRNLLKKNPGMFAMREDGKRTYYHGQNRIRWCPSSPDVEKYYLDTWDGGDWIGIGEGDTRGFCRCKACMALDKVQPKNFKGFSTTNRYIDLAKRVRAKAMKRNPNVKISILMYMDYIMPPTNESDLSWMYGKFVPYGSGIEECNYPMKESNHKFLVNLWNEWGKTGIKMNYRPNYLLTGYAIPALDIRQSGEMLRHAAANGMCGFDYDSLRGNWATKGPMLYMHLRLGTDPDMTIPAIMKEYYSAFGPAAKLVEKYFNYWIDYTKNVIKGGGVGFMAANTAAEYYTPQVFDKPAKILEEALKAAETSPDKIYAERVKFIRHGLRHGKLCVEFSHLFKANKFSAAREKLNEIIAFRKQYGKTGFVDLVNITSTEMRGYKTLGSFLKGKFLHLDEPGLTAKKVDRKSFHKLTLRPSKWALSIDKKKKSGTVIRKYSAGNNNSFVEATLHINARVVKVNNKLFISYDDKEYTLIAENVTKKSINLNKYVKGKNLFYVRFDTERKANSKLDSAEMSLLSYRMNYALANPEEQKARPKVDMSGDWREFNPQWGFRKDIFEKGLPKEDMMPETFDLAKWTRVDVPARLDATPVGPYCGYGFYGAKFQIPADWAAREVNFLFHAVDEQAWVYVNGKLVGEHSEKSEKVDIGVLWDEPFIIKVKPEDIRPGKDNVIVVKTHNIKGASGIWKKIQIRPVDASAYL